MREALRGCRIQGLDGRTVSLDELRGQVVVVNLWASWCIPCRRELPELAAFHGEISGRGGRVIPVSIDLERRNAERFVRRYGIGLPVFHDGQGDLAKRLDVDGVPFTLVIDRSGQIAFAGHGSDAREIERLKAVTRSLLASPPTAQAGSGQ
jgi:cytochrome c-type biogenesis protein